MEILLFFGSLVFLLIWISSLKKTINNKTDPNIKIPEKDLSKQKLPFETEEKQKKQNLNEFGRFISNQKIKERINSPLSKDDEELLESMPGWNSVSSLNSERNYQRFGVHWSNNKIKARLDFPDYKKQVYTEKRRESKKVQLERQAELNREMEKNFSETGNYESDEQRNKRLQDKKQQERDNIIKESIDKYSKNLQSVFPKENIKINYQNITKNGILPSFFELDFSQGNLSQLNRSSRKFEKGTGKPIAIHPCPIGCVSRKGETKYLYNWEAIKNQSENQKEKFKYYACKNGLGYHFATANKEPEVYEESFWQDYI